MNNDSSAVLIEDIIDGSYGETNADRNISNLNGIQADNYLSAEMTNSPVKKS